MRPTVQPFVVVQEELPVADDTLPHEQKRHGRLEWSEARVVEAHHRGLLSVKGTRDAGSGLDAVRYRIPLPNHLLHLLCFLGPIRGRGGPWRSLRKSGP